MNTVAYMALHYGKDYIYWSIKSVIDYVDRFVVLYSPVGSHGSRTTLACPDSRDDLYRLAALAARDKLTWIDGEWPHEGAQRNAIHEYAPDADVIVVIDADEVWTKSAIEGAIVVGHYQQAKLYRVPMIHYWRSFYRAVTDDRSYPVRLILPNVRSGNETLNQAMINSPLAGPFLINHMGYAQNAAIVEYKQHTHGHRAEWRANWYQDRFLVNAQYDCHPVNIDYWNPVTVDPWQYLPEFMRHHPYANKELIP